MKTQANQNQRTVIVMDNGTAFSKIGYAGNNKPDHIIPTCVGVNRNDRPKFEGFYDLDFVIGKDAIKEISNPSYDLIYPIKRGKIVDWGAMERFWERSFYQYLRCDPEDHNILLTDPVLNNGHKQREDITEIMFETFNVKGLSIVTEHLCGLPSSWCSKKSENLKTSGCTTGTIVEIGDGLTQISTLTDGHILPGSSTSFPFGGQDITEFVHQITNNEREFEYFPSSEEMKEKKKGKEEERTIEEEEEESENEFEIYDEDTNIFTISANSNSLLRKTIKVKHYFPTVEESCKIKERHCYVCKDIPFAFKKFNNDPEIFIREHIYVSNKRKSKIGIGYLRFLGPELFFQPEISSSIDNIRIKPLHKLVDQAILRAPIDHRRDLYKNIVLSGGSAKFKNLGLRLEKDLRELNRKRNVNINVIVPPIPILDYSVWFGASMLAGNNSFHNCCRTKEEYKEFGPSLCAQQLLFS